jgi:hypothetical protein
MLYILGFNGTRKLKNQSNAVVYNAFMCIVCVLKIEVGKCIDQK